MAKLGDREIEVILGELEGWSSCEDKAAIERHLVFKDFNEAFAFMTAVALKAEKMNHHPEWTNVYHRLDIILMTHDEGGVTAKDITLARFINKILANKTS